MNTPCIAVLIPCFNESLTVSKVIADFKRELPHATIYVFDNNSTDASAEIALQAGATVIREKKQGKGFVIASMLNKVVADVYVMVDADDTYSAEHVHKLFEPLFSGQADMVVGQRLSTYTHKAFRPLHVFGNRLVVSLINLIFSSELTDVMSGYRAFTGEVAVSLPVVASGFDVETEMTLQLLYRRFVIREVPVPYKERPVGSTSKLNTFKDGIRVIFKILGIFKAYKPFTFFGGLGLFSFFVGIIPHLHIVLGLFRGFQYVTLFDIAASMASLSCCITLIVAGAIIHTLNFRILEMTSILTRNIQQTKTAGILAREKRVS